jgi:selenide,water dikinase
MLTNADARVGDWLVLTKPLGTGVITTGIKRGLVPERVAHRAIVIMSQLNRVGAELAEQGLLRGATDVTGYGLLGHLGSMCRASGVGAELDATRVPAISDEVFKLIASDCIPGGSRENLRAANPFTDWQRTGKAYQFLLTDAQTSGGLLLCVPQRHLAKVRAVLKDARTACAAIIGRIVRSRTPRVTVNSQAAATGRWP